LGVKRGDVVLLVASGDLGKPRPGVIVQADELGDTSTSVLVCPMSSDLSEFRRTRPVVEPSVSNGLRARSQIMTDKINALRRDRIRQVTGALDPDASERLDRAMLVVLGLAR
jgi:mRNA interferase MazF